MSKLLGAAFAVISVAILNGSHSFARNAEMDAALDTQFELMRKQAPLEIDEITKLTNVMRIGPSITYTYETKIPEASWTPLLREAAFQRYLKVNCLGSKNARMILDHGYSVRHVILDDQKNFVANVLITKDKCPSP